MISSSVNGSNLHQSGWLRSPAFHQTQKWDIGSRLAVISPPTEKETTFSDTLNIKAILLAHFKQTWAEITKKALGSQPGSSWHQGWSEASGYLFTTSTHTQWKIFRPEIVLSVWCILFLILWYPQQEACLICSTFHFPGLSSFPWRARGTALGCAAT